MQVRNLNAIRRVFEEHGIEFLGLDGVRTTGVIEKKNDDCTVWQNSSIRHTSALAPRRCCLQNAIPIKSGEALPTHHRRQASRLGSYAHFFATTNQCASAMLP
jgi:hypothetical protein